MSNIKLPEGFIERVLSSILTFGMGFTLTGFACLLYDWKTADFWELILRSAGLEFLVIFSSICWLVFIWCIFTPKWIPRILDFVSGKILKVTFFILSILLILLTTTIWTASSL